jgi:hypothetical protein
LDPVSPYILTTLWPCGQSSLMNFPLLHLLLAVAKGSGLTRVWGSVGISEPDFPLCFNNYRYFICQTVSDQWKPSWVMNMEPLPLSFPDNRAFSASFPTLLLRIPSLSRVSCTTS